eukprot:2025226-Prymnesium_polylepis.1
MVPLAGSEQPLAVMAFYCPGSGLTAWDKATGGAPLGNFWPLPSNSKLKLEHNGKSGDFSNSEAAYQCLKWWQHDPTRRGFEGCSAAGVGGGEQAFELKKTCEKDPELGSVSSTRC